MLSIYSNQLMANQLPLILKTVSISSLKSINHLPIRLSKYDVSGKRFTTIIAEPQASFKGTSKDCIKHDSVHSLNSQNPDVLVNQNEEILTPPAFDHPAFTKQQMESITFEHRPAKTIRDKIALLGIKTLRTGFDIVTGYKHPKNKEEQLNPGIFAMTPEKWLTRFIFLESIAGIPGMVAGFLRHLHSLRLLKRDKAWVETLLDEAYNERMHLLTFIKIGKPGLITRSILYVGQGVFCNIFFLCYLFSPLTCHRFVGYLEEEAVATYSRCIEDIDYGLLKDFENYKVPEIAKSYWHMGENPTMRDLILYIRADEAKHREVNHTLANLKIQTGKDRNPFALKVKCDRPQPSHNLETHKGKGWERDEIVL
ncbi:alternative oxidase [Ascoidea rubescens DSM 1968]|uniref:Alternative oxidase n=1 Tax=Ascoidea rubescens DSM 1968 TaxID=1344418 RepID=A0A1D2VES7_9ASCO|nr:alternative oxidase [Ascoidea rubescens DSM 1968]ODV60119.1 alternative oxidase [Ascoidea rubescens DSM 1968]